MGRGRRVIYIHSVKEVFYYWMVDIVVNPHNRFNYLGTMGRGRGNLDSPIRVSKCFIVEPKRTALYRAMALNEIRIESSG